MANTENVYKPVDPSYRVQYKAIPKCQHGGPSMDVMLPPGKSAEDLLPVVILYHGGAFTVGASSDLPHAQVQWYLREGFAVVSPEYRLTPHVSLKEIKEDLLDSYMFICSRLNDKLSELSGGKAPKLDVQRSISSGGSAGGSSCLYLALEILKYNDDMSDPSKKLPVLRGVIPAYPFCEPDGQDVARSVLEERSRKECPEDWELLKQVYDEPTAVDFKTNSMPLVNRDPRTVWCMKAAEYRCLNSFHAGQDPPYPSTTFITPNLRPDFPPCYVLVAEVDSLIPPKHSYDLVSRLKELGAEVHMGVGKNAEHGFTEWDTKLWPEGCDWWEATILPALRWAKSKLV